MELKENHIIENQELADWFGIKKSSLEAGGMKKKKLEELKEYCDFEILKGKVFIKKVYIDTYTKNRSKIYKTLLQEMPKQIKNGQPWTCTQIGNYYYYKYNKSLGGLESTYEYNTRKVRNEIWGKPQKEGNIRRVFCKMNKGATPKGNKYELLTIEEKKIVKEIAKNYFNFLNPEEQLISFSLMYEGKKEEAIEYFADIANYKSTSYMEFICQVAETLKCDWMVNATIIDNTTLKVSKASITKIER